MNGDTLLRLTDLKVFSQPFPYFTATACFGGSVSAVILEWLERDPPWKLVEADFYEQYEFGLFDVAVPSEIAFMKCQSFLDELRARIEGIFNVSLQGKIDCTIHKLVAGQRIRIHNDFIPKQESHRVLVQLNRGWRVDQGGLLMFFNSQDPSDVHQMFLPIHNSVVGFAISEASNHAVSTIHGGDRFTLVFSLYATDSA